MKRLFAILMACCALVACDNDDKLVMPDWQIDPTMTTADLEGDYWGYIHEINKSYFIESGEFAGGQSVGGIYNHLIFFENGQMMHYVYTPRVVNFCPKHAIRLSTVAYSLDTKNKRFTNPLVPTEMAKLLQLTKDRVVIETSPATVATETTYKMSFVQLTRTTLSDEVRQLIENAIPEEEFDEWRKENNPSYK